MHLRTGHLRTELRRLARLGAVVAVLLLVAGACGAAEDELRPGMSQQEVERLLGPPDRKAVLVGKLLRDFEQLAPGEDPASFRQVYIYESGRLQVWFKDGQVTGITRDGIAVQ